VEALLDRVGGGTPAIQYITDALEQLGVCVCACVLCVYFFCVRVYVYVSVGVCVCFFVH
jgi:uncharacterized membrane protein YccC